jgi:hypothetical protein
MGWFTVVFAIIATLVVISVCYIFLKGGRETTKERRKREIKELRDK